MTTLDAPQVSLPTALEIGPPLFERASTVTVGTTQVQNIGNTRGLRVWFQAKRTLKAGEANTCDLKIWNLSPDTLGALATSSQKSTLIAAPPTGIPGVAGKPVNVIPVQIDAGFVNLTSTIFLGEMRAANSVTDGPDTVTELTTGDGDTALQLQRMTASFAAGTTPIAVVQKLLAQMGVGQGNLAAVQSVFTGAQGGVFARGVTMKGNPSRILRQLCASLGLELSIQNGGAQFLSLGQPVAGKAVLLSESSGMIGSPTVDTAGILSIMSLIQPGLSPGSSIQVQSKYVNGLFRVLSVEYEGDTWGDDWYARIEAGSYGVAP